MKSDIERRAVELAEYIIENKTTVRAAAKHFGVSKSTVHTVVVKQNGLCGLFNNRDAYLPWQQADMRLFTIL